MSEPSGSRPPLQPRPHTASMYTPVPGALLRAADRECPICGADIVGNDPHAAWCDRGEVPL